MRTFIAIDLDEAVREWVSRLQTRLKSRCPAIGWTRASQMHVTLKFLGEIDETQAAEVSGALEELAAGAPAFEIGTERLGVFPPRGPIRVLWLGLRDPSGGLGTLAAQVERRMEELGFEREGRPFSPHLTLARVRNPGESEAVRTAMRSITIEPGASQRVCELAFYRSTLGGGGAMYEAISRHGLRG